MRINFKHLFDWRVESISEPYLLRMNDMYLPIYAVDVKYVHHGNRRRVFFTDDFQKSTSYGVACKFVDIKKRQMAQTKTK